MTSCADLDPFFDGEISEEAAADFREHLARCSRCQAALRGRMQEEAVVGEWAERDAQHRVVDARPAVEIGEWAERDAQHRVAGARPAHRARRHMLVYLAPILAVAAAVAIWLGTRSDPATDSTRFGVARPSPLAEVALEIEHRGAVTRSGTDTAGEARDSVAQVGDVLRSTVRGEDHLAIWVYLEDRELVTACPGGPECSNAGGSLTLELRVAAPGRYSIIAISSAQPIVAPHGSLDTMLGSIAAEGAHFVIKHVDIN
jgi:hypothetical protein